jgi:Phage derived protein Gp49-like (DUF891)
MVQTAAIPSPSVSDRRQDSARSLGRDAGERVVYRLLFAVEGERAQILLSLSAFKKKTQATPPEQIKLAERRLRDWRSRSRTATIRQHQPQQE